MQAAGILKQEFGIDAEIWSVTSFNELRRNCESVARYNRLHPKAKVKRSTVARQLGGQPDIPVIAATDYMKLYAEQIRQDIDADYHVLGTDGFGRSDTRQALRQFFEVNANMVAYTALQALQKQGVVTLDEVMAAQTTLGIDAKRADPDKS